jgi:hypothetical protein
MSTATRLKKRAVFWSIGRISGLASEASAVA